MFTSSISLQSTVILDAIDTDIALYKYDYYHRKYIVLYKV